MCVCVSALACGSIIRGHLRALLTMMPFSILTLSVGRPAMVHARIYTHTHTHTNTHTHGTHTTILSIVQGCVLLHRVELRCVPSSHALVSLHASVCVCVCVCVTGHTFTGSCSVLIRFVPSEWGTPSCESLAVHSWSSAVRYVGVNGPTHTHIHTHRHVLLCEPDTDESPVCMLCKADWKQTRMHTGFISHHS